MRQGGRRAKLVLVVLTFCWAVVAARLGYLQIFRHGYYEMEARRRHWERVELPAQRGRVLDRHGVPLALNRSCYSIRILPQYARDKDTLAEILAAFGLEEKENIRSLLDRYNHPFWYRRRIDLSQADSLRQVLIQRRLRNCTLVDDDTRRVYPFGALCATLIGCVGLEHGLAGIEAEYDSILGGRPGWMLLQRDACGYSYPDPSYPVEPAVAGADISLTIDLDIQAIVYEELRRAVERSAANRGSVLVLDASSAEVLALVDYPGFEPEQFRAWPESLWRSSAVGDQFEPGSSFKLVTLLAALLADSAGTIASRMYDVSSGEIQVGECVIHDIHPNGVLSFDSIFIQSSNVGCARLSQLVDSAVFHRTALELGFGSPVCMGLPYEGTGRLPRPAALKGIDYATATYGQGGVMVTLMQLAAAYLCVANDGQYRKPFIIKSVRHNGRTLVEYRPVALRQAVPERVCRRAKDILRRAVANGTGRLADIPGHNVCGKTGTAQKVVAGRHSPTKSRMTFIGFFPQEQPRYLIAVLVDEPKTVRFAGSVACPLFRDIALKLIELERVREARLAPLASLESR